ncbi:MAG: hypothetical protein WBC69_18130, partial [Geitlerinemataceae cyanobacterium]
PGTARTACSMVLAQDAQDIPRTLRLTVFMAAVFLDDSQGDDNLLRFSLFLRVSHKNEIRMKLRSCTTVNNSPQLIRFT